MIRSDAPTAAGAASTPLWAPALPARPPAGAARERFLPPQPPPPAGWLQTGLLLMTLPMAITARMMMAPAFWMLGVRRRR